MTDETIEEQLPPYLIEGARSSRSRCKTCRRKIDKGALRIGILIEGPYGIGYLWHHIRCAARQQFEKVEEAYGLEAWKGAKEPLAKVPSLDELRKYSEETEEKKRVRKQIPYAELDPSGRAKCKHCGEPMEKGSLRVVLGRAVYFHAHDRSWFDERSWKWNIAYRPWKSINADYMKLLVPDSISGRVFLEVLALVEEAFPGLATRVGEQPLLLIEATQG